MNTIRGRKTKRGRRGQERVEELVLPDQPGVPLPAPREEPYQQAPLRSNRCTRSDPVGLNERPTHQESHIVQKISIGTGHTEVLKDRYDRVDWLNYDTATRTLLRAVFSSFILASRTLTGYLPYPPHGRTLRLKKSAVNDIIVEVTRRFRVCSACVKRVIVAKCFEECMFRRGLEQRWIDIEREVRLRYTIMFHPRAFG
ncbi:hypothetical protein MSG28_013307 [Choristoneura fumiferana]|uniref:Uncharacterized protein n=1 Tax=Choristoneura fumiferana TaxID=7141 RepID=A0ACC0KTH4_CHOFU|nr:hypothetical protein MSG28_013307 [Choristoneura fumiferana]